MALPAQGLLWTQMQPPQSPGARGWHAMAFDGARQRTVLHGGYSAGGELGDTWTFDGLTWAPQPQAALPTRRWHAMAYDAAHQVVVMYGGQSAGSYPTTTYLWNGTSWTAVTTATHPGGRSKHAMAYDAARQRVVLYGGAVPFGNSETWEWDGTAWTMQNPPTNPNVRNEHAMAYDAPRQRVVLFGGQLGPQGNFAYANDTWTWDGSAWQQVATSTAPSTPRYPTRGMAYDGSRHEIVLFSGSNSLADTWVFDGSNWTQVATVPSPAARQNHALVYDDARQSLVLFGGSVGTYFADTWISYLLASASTYGAGCGSPALGLVPDPTARPVLGHSARVTVTDVPAGVAAIGAGWSRTNFFGGTLPFSLAQFGLPGCDLLMSADLMGLPTAAVGGSTFDGVYALNLVPVMLGLRCHLQAYALAPGQNAAQTIVSNGVEWVFGAQ